MNLVVDIGNSAIKIGVFQNDKLIHFEQLKSLPGFLWKKFVAKHRVSYSIVCSVGANNGRQLAKELGKFTHAIYLSDKTLVPIKNNYKTPKTLGKDRLAVAVAGAGMFPKENVLIIQAGTCLTFDFINFRKEYIGGAISPGLAMRFKALHTFTAGLPLVKPENISYRSGTSTAESILSGVINGMRDEMDGAIVEYKRKYKNLKVLLTGGDAYFYESQLKNEIFAQPNLVLYGLNKILEHNV